MGPTGKMFTVLEQGAQLCEFCEDEFQIITKNGQDMIVFDRDREICMVVATSETTGKLVLRLTLYGDEASGERLDFSLEENPVLFQPITIPEEEEYEGLESPVFDMSLS